MRRRRGSRARLALDRSLSLSRSGFFSSVFEVFFRASTQSRSAQSARDAGRESPRVPDSISNAPEPLGTSREKTGLLGRAAPAHARLYRALRRRRSARRGRHQAQRERVCVCARVFRKREAKTTSESGERAEREPRGRASGVGKRERERERLATTARPRITRPFRRQKNPSRFARILKPRSRFALAGTVRKRTRLSRCKVSKRDVASSCSRDCGKRGFGTH